MRRFVRVFLLCSLLLAGCSTDVVLNEFVALNQNGLIGPSGSPDWIELYNVSGGEVTLDDWFISDDVGLPEKAPLAGLTVPANGHLLLIASGDPTLGDNHLPFRLNGEGETIVLTGPQGSGDEVTYYVQQPDVAMARIPDGTGDWVEATPTPGAANQ